VSKMSGHRLFMVYVRHGIVQQVGDLRVNAPARHVSVLGHRHLGVPEMVRTDPGGQSRIIDERCHGLAEAVRRHVGHPELDAYGAPRGTEVFWITKLSAALITSVNQCIFSLWRNVSRPQVVK
jgi:hypothetical protein